MQFEVRVAKGASAEENRNENRGAHFIFLFVEACVFDLIVDRSVGSCGFSLIKICR